MTHEITRVLLVTPPRGVPVTAQGAGTIDWTDLTASLRRLGLQTEVYDASAAGRGLDSVLVQIEHFWPQVVIAVADGTTTANSLAVLQSAKKIVPRVVTVLVGSRALPDREGPRHGAPVDYDLRGAGVQAEVELLAGLCDGERSHGIESPGHARRGSRALSVTWLFSAHGK